MFFQRKFLRDSYGISERILDGNTGNILEVTSGVNPTRFPGKISEVPPPRGIPVGTLERIPEESTERITENAPCDFLEELSKTFFGNF